MLSPEEKKIVAYHEAGHATVSWFLEHAHPLLKVSIIPRGSGALGYAMYMPEERHIYTKEQLIDMICSALGGRAAEEIVFNSITTGAADDLQKVFTSNVVQIAELTPNDTLCYQVTNIAYSQMLKLGMSETLGPATFGSLHEEGFVGKQFSDKTSQMVDNEVRQLVQDCYERTKKVILDNYQGTIQYSNQMCTTNNSLNYQLQYSKNWP